MEVVIVGNEVEGVAGVIHVVLYPRTSSPQQRGGDDTFPASGTIRRAPRSSLRCLPGRLGGKPVPGDAG